MAVLRRGPAVVGDDPNVDPAQRRVEQAGVGPQVAEVDLAGENPRQEALLLLVGAELDDGRAHRVEGDERDGRPSPARLLQEDQLFDGAAALPAVLLGPPDAQPAVFAHLADRRLPSLAHHLVVEVARGPRLHQIGEVDAQLVLKGLLLGRQVEIHRPAA